MPLYLPLVWSFMGNLSISVAQKWLINFQPRRFHNEWSQVRQKYMARDVTDYIRICQTIVTFQPSLRSCPGCLCLLLVISQTTIILISRVKQVLRWTLKLSGGSLADTVCDPTWGQTLWPMRASLRSLFISRQFPIDERWTLNRWAASSQRFTSDPSGHVERLKEGLSS